MNRTGIYPGSFDPIHKGHIDIINRATKLVDKLLVFLDGGSEFFLHFVKGKVGLPGCGCGSVSGSGYG